MEFFQQAILSNATEIYFQEQWLLNEDSAKFLTVL